MSLSLYILNWLKDMLIYSLTYSAALTILSLGADV